MVYRIEEVTGYVSGVQAHGAIHCLRCLTDGVLNFPQAVTAVFEVSGVQESYPRGQSEASCPEVRNCTYRMEKLGKGQSVASLCSAPLYSYVVFTFFFLSNYPASLFTYRLDCTVRVYSSTRVGVFVVWLQTRRGSQPDKGVCNDAVLAAVNETLCGASEAGLRHM